MSGRESEGGRFAALTRAWEHADFSVKVVHQATSGANHPPSTPTNKEALQVKYVIF